MAPIGLYDRLCHAFLVLHVFFKFLFVILKIIVVITPIYTCNCKQRIVSMARKSGPDLDFRAIEIYLLTSIYLLVCFLFLYTCECLYQ